MASLQQAVSTIQQIDYAAIVVFTAVGYDYILTFSDEVEYIWRKPWTRISTLFFLARYVGLCCAISMNLGDALIITYRWGFCIFISAAEMVMILRVWTLYHQSRFILVILLPIYFTEVVTSLIAAIAYSVQSNSGGASVEVLNFSFCLPQTFPAIYIEIIDVAQLVLGTLMCLFIGFRFIRESLQVYKTRTQLQFSNYVELFMREGILYYLAILTLALIDFIPLLGVPINMWATVAEYVPVFTLVSRFIMNLRALYAHNVQGSDENDIDTAFGFVSTDHTLGQMMFAEARPSDDWERDNETAMERKALRGAA